MKPIIIDLTEYHSWSLSACIILRPSGFLAGIGWKDSAAECWRKVTAICHGPNVWNNGDKPSWLVVAPKWGGSCTFDSIRRRHTAGCDLRTGCQFQDSCSSHGMSIHQLQVKSLHRCTLNGSIGYCANEKWKAYMMRCSSIHGDLWQSSNPYVEASISLNLKLVL